MSTKYLSSFIDGFQASSFRNGAPDCFTPQPFARDVQADELKQILLDAKEGLEVKNTTHEFYETLERITNELRGMTEHSTAFLSRVRKSDAPDYFNIIKNPMDFGTVLKKVKAQQYKDKSSFKADLDLIWDNCLLYNTLPNHPLRRSAMTLRSRANHLLEFVTDPVASTPTPQITHSQSASRFDRPGSRLDALDASHVVISTANLLGESKGDYNTERRQESPAEMEYRDDSVPLKHEEKEGSSLYDEDFQDMEEDEEDESIRTRKGLTSQKSQPGGGRNLELLKGLAAQHPSIEAGPSADEALSIYPSGLDTELSSSSSAVEGTSPIPGSATAGVPSIPEVPGTYPGQGSALLARRATGISHISRDKRIKTRTPSMTPVPASIPLAQRPALRRTPDLMGKFAELDTASEEVRTETYGKLLQGSFETNVLPVLISAALANDFSGHAGDVSGPSTLTRLARRSPSSSTSHPDADLEWWQAVCSDALLANGMPDVPAVPCKRKRAVQQKIVELDPIKQRPLNPSWDDLACLKKIKRTHHKLAVLRRDTPGISTNTDFEDGEASDDEGLNSRGDSSAGHSKRRALLKLGEPNAESMTAAIGQLTLQMFCSTLLEHAGFDYVQRSALDNLSTLLAQYLLSLGAAAAFHRDHHTGRPSLGSMLKNALHDVASDDAFPVGCDPLNALKRYRETDIPKRSRELASLSTRLDLAYDSEIEEAQNCQPRLRLEKDVQEIESMAGEDEEATSDPAECWSAYALVRMLLEAESDHLGLEDMQIPNETGFPLHLIYASFLRQAFPSSCGDLSKPFNPPPSFISLIPLSESQSRSEAIQSTIGLLQPFLQARSDSAYDLYDDDDLPLATQTDVQKALATRPDVPYTTGRVILGKRKREVAPASIVPTLPNSGLNLAAGSALSGTMRNRPMQAAEKPKKPKIV